MNIENCGHWNVQQIHKDDGRVWSFSKNPYLTYVAVIYVKATFCVASENVWFGDCLTPVLPYGTAFIKKHPLCQ